MKKITCQRRTFPSETRGNDRIGAVESFCRQKGLSFTRSHVSLFLGRERNVDKLGV